MNHCHITIKNINNKILSKEIIEKISSLAIYGGEYYLNEDKYFHIEKKDGKTCWDNLLEHEIIKIFLNCPAWEHTSNVLQDLAKISDNIICLYSGESYLYENLVYYISKNQDWIAVYEVTDDSDLNLKKQLCEEGIKRLENISNKDEIDKEIKSINDLIAKKTDFFF